MVDAIEIKWDVIGAKLATLSDEEQAKFFNGFAIELNNFETHFQRENQMLSIGDKLSEHIKNTLEKYLPSIWYKE